MEESLMFLQSTKTKASDYPHSVSIVQDLIPVFNTTHLITGNKSKVFKLILQELHINDPSKDPSDEEIRILGKLCDEGDDCIQIIREDIRRYRVMVEEIVRSLSLSGPGVCVLENVFSQDFMNQFQAWVDEYLQQDTASKKDHFAFGTNKRIWRVPEKLPSDLLYSYLQYEVDKDDHKTPAFNHVIDRWKRIMIVS